MKSSPSEVAVTDQIQTKADMQPPDLSLVALGGAGASPGCLADIGPTEAAASAALKRLHDGSPLWQRAALASEAKQHFD